MGWGLSRGGAGRRITPIRWRFSRDWFGSFVFNTDSRERKEKERGEGEGPLVELAGLVLGLLGWAGSGWLAGLAGRLRPVSLFFFDNKTLSLFLFLFSKLQIKTVQNFL